MRVRKQSSKSPSDKHHLMFAFQNIIPILYEHCAGQGHGSLIEIMGVECVIHWLQPFHYVLARQELRDTRSTTFAKEEVQKMIRNTKSVKAELFIEYLDQHDCHDLIRLAKEATRLF